MDSPASNSSTQQHPSPKSDYNWIDELLVEPPNYQEYAVILEEIRHEFADNNTISQCNTSEIVASYHPERDLSAPKQVLDGEQTLGSNDETADSADIGRNATERHWLDDKKRSCVSCQPTVEVKNPDICKKPPVGLNFQLIQERSSKSPLRLGDGDWARMQVGCEPIQNIHSQQHLNQSRIVAQAKRAENSQNLSSAPYPRMVTNSSPSECAITRRSGGEGLLGTEAPNKHSLSTRLLSNDQYETLEPNTLLAGNSITPGSSEDRYIGDETGKSSPREPSSMPGGSSLALKPSEDMHVAKDEAAGEKAYPCLLCSKSFSRRWELTLHTEGHREKRPYQCKECPKSFTVRKQFMRHVKIHTRDRPYQCLQCPKSFALKKYLEAHIKIHIGNRPYQCLQCPKSFAFKKSLEAHNKIHTGEKPYRCEKCSKSFLYRCNLTIHNRLHTGEKAFQCQECSKSFPRKGALLIHNKIHSPDGPYHCLQCPKSFALKNYLEVHIKIHTGEKPYQCQECSKSFLYRYHLSIHNRLHTGEKPFQCHECSKSFARKGTLLRHNKIHAREQP